jgi:hypothetical protein
MPGPFWFPFWRPVGPGERLCWLCFWMTPPSPPPPVYEEHHHYYDETSSQQQAPPPVYSTEPIIVEALLMNPSSTAAGYRELYAVDYKQGDNPEKFYVQIPLDATPGSFLECRLGSKNFIIIHHHLLIIIIHKSLSLLLSIIR